MTKLMIRTVCVVAVAILIGGCMNQSAPTSDIRLYALDCGSIEVDDMSAFSMDGDFDGQSYSLVVPCYLIRHPDGDLLWDTGFDQSLADTPDGLSGGGFHSKVSKKLTDQLAEIGLGVDDIKYVSISHSHPDHAGNVGLFKTSTFVMSELEYAHMFSDEMRNTDPAFASYAHVESDQTIRFDDEYDVFGDERVVIMSMPGHTPGSTVLQLQLEKAGTVLFSGDLITHAAGRRIGAVPTFNSDAAQTRESIAKFEALAAAENALVIIQHEPMDFEKLPIFPAWLD